MPKKETKKQERKPKKTAQTTQRKAKLTRLQKLEQEKQELFDRFCKLTTTNREKADYICKQREQINKLVNANINATNEIYACQLEKDKIIASNSLTIKKMEREAIAKIRKLKAGLILSLAVNIICIIIILYLINY